MEKLIKNEFAEILTQEQVEIIIEEINRKESEETMTLGERAIKGLKEKAIREGKAEGRIEY